MIHRTDVFFHMLHVILLFPSLLCFAPAVGYDVILPSDRNSDGVVDIKDFALLGLQWLISTDIDDLDILSQQWLDCTRTSDAECWPTIESAMSDQWIEQAFTGAVPQPPFSFIYNGVSSASFLGTWNFSRSSTVLDANRTQWMLVYTEPSGPLKVTCQATEYHDYPAVEWVVWFENCGSTDTPIIENIQALDAAFGSDNSGDFGLYYNGGTNNSINDYAPLQTTLGVNTNQRFVPYGGRPSDLVLPFFNLAKRDGTGIVLGIGWTGRWAAMFARGSDTTANVQAGMEITHLKLYPGEKIRIPAILTLFWSGDDRMRGHNQWRRLLLEHYSPYPDGLPVNPPVSSSVHGTIGFNDTSQQNVMSFIAATKNNSLPVDYIWIDAGWYDDYGTGNWVWTGTWEPDPLRFPNGIKPIADYAHSNGYKFLLWFEPERVMPGSWLYNNHPDWVLAPANLPPERQYQADWRLLDYSNPAALDWAKSYFSTFIKNNGVDIYRQDCNLHPLWYWRNGEAADRQGMREIKHVMGMYEYLDFLVSENPGLILDVCAGTGSRVDFEIMRRTLNLTRSDGEAFWDPIANQSKTYGYSFWGPITGLGAVSLDPYDFRSGMGSFFTCAYNANDPSTWAPACNLLNQYLSIRHLFTGDYYPLTAYSLADNVWMAWQYNAPELGQGLVQTFRRPSSTVAAMTFKLQGLDASATYTVRNLDGGAATNTGDDLMNTGLTVNISSTPGSALITYTKN